MHARVSAHESARWASQVSAPSWPADAQRSALLCGLIGDDNDNAGVLEESFSVAKDRFGELVDVGFKTAQTYP